MSNRRYVVTVVEHTIEDAPAGKEWMQGAGEGGVYGYTPEIIKKKNVERKVYEQNIDDLDLIAVIKAINVIRDP